MDLETKFKKETGFDAYADNDLRPKVPSDYYVEWLEEQLTLTDVSQQRELFKSFLQKVVQETEVGDLTWQTRDEAKELLKLLNCG